MRAMLLWAFVCLLMMVPKATAQVVVEILGATTEVYSYEPAYVVFEVRNEGDDPVVIPADTCTHEGAFLRMGREGEELRDRYIASDCSPQRVVRLPPQGRLLFLADHALGREGVYELRAALRSPGECSGLPVGPNKGKIEAVRPIERGSHPYDCWSGTVQSATVRIKVSVPMEPVDLAAAEFLELDHVRWSNNWQNVLRASVRKLFERFPTSHYTYASHYAGGGNLSMLNVVILQPDNPLNPWATGAMAAGLAYRHRPCARPYKERPGGPPDLAQRYERVIAAYPPPKPLEDYLHQLAVEYATEECSRKVEEGSSDDEPHSP